MWRLQERRPRSITHAQWQACVRAITIGGLNNVGDSRNALSEHLNVVVSTDTMRCALHEVGLESLEKVLGEEWRISITSSSCESHNKTCRWWCNFCVGSMTSRGLDLMHKIEGKMTQALYVSILQDEVMKKIEWYHFNPSLVIFQHDNDPKHIAKLVKQWLSMQNLDVLTWPPRSPNLNPMKHVWVLVKQRLNEYPTPIRGML